MADRPHHARPWSNHVARRPAVAVAGVFIGGIVFHPLLPHMPVMWITLALFAAIAAITWFRHELYSSVTIALALFLAAVGAAQIEAYYFRDDDIAAYASDEPRLAKVELEIVQPLRIIGTHFQTARPMPPARCAC
jgi:hypothetical protein